MAGKRAEDKPKRSGSHDLRRRSQTLHPHGILTEVIEQNRIIGRLRRLGEHLPIIHSCFGTVFGLFIVPFVLLVFFIFAGTVGFSILGLAFLECGLFLMAVFAFIVSVIIPIALSVTVAFFTLLAYRMMKALKEFLWKYFGGPVRLYRSVKRMFADPMSLFSQVSQEQHEPDVDQENEPKQHGQNVPQYSNNNGPSVPYPETPLYGVETQQESYASFTDEIQDIRRRISRPVIVYDEYDDDLPDDMGLVDGSFLYMADFIHNLTSLSFAIFIIYIVVKYTSCDS